MLFIFIFFRLIISAYHIRFSDEKLISLFVFSTFQRIPRSIDGAKKKSVIQHNFFSRCNFSDFFAILLQFFENIFQQDVYNLAQNVTNFFYRTTNINI